MELRQLEHFVAVAEEQSFTRAAQRTNIVQSGLSMSIRALERELGSPLFVRGRARVSLTDAGRALLPEARRATAAVRAAADAVAATQGLLRGTLSVGSAPALPVAFDLPTLLGRFRSAYPKIRLDVREDSAAALLRDVRSGALDVGLVASPGGPAPRGVTTIPVARSPMMLVCDASHRLASRRRVSVNELADEAFIDFDTNWTIRAIADRLCTEAGVDRDTIVVANDVPFLLGFVEHGLGVSLVPEVVRRFPANVRYVPLRARQPWWHLVIAHAGDGQPSAAVRALCALIRQAHGSA